MKDIKKWRDAYPDNTGLADNADNAAKPSITKDALQESWAVSTGLEAADRSADFATEDEYSRTKDRMTASVPMTSQW